MRPRRKRNAAQSDSDDADDTSDSDSDTSVVNGGATNKRKTPVPRGRGRPKKQKVVADESDEDVSSQQGTSGLADTNNVQTTSQAESDSGEETPDSDYMPVADDIDKRKKDPPAKKKGRPSARVSPRKKTIQNNSLNKPGTSSQNGTSGVSRLASATKFSRLSTSSSSSKDSGTAVKPEVIEGLAHKLVYFLLIEDQKKYAIRKKAIVAHVFKDDGYSPKLYLAVLNKANSILMKTYGMEIMHLENQKDGYLLINILKREFGVEDYVELTQAKHQQHGFLLYLLTVIYMNGNCITEDELGKALKAFKLDFSSKKLHPVFGDVKKYITVELVKQMYLNYDCVSKDPPRYEITWGLRAKEEVDKKDLLQFACQIMDDTTPENWILQYKDAEEAASQV